MGPVEEPELCFVWQLYTEAWILEYFYVTESYIAECG